MTKGKVEKFEDLVIWQMARALCREAYQVTVLNHHRDYAFCDQIRRAAISIMNNIAEGHERGSNRDFAKFLFIARGSCGEVRSLLYVALDQSYVTQEEFERLQGECRQCSAAIWGLIKSLQRSSGWVERVQVGILMALACWGLSYRATG